MADKIRTFELFNQRKFIVVTLKVDILCTNQKVLQDAIKQGKKIEVRSVTKKVEELGLTQGNEITISEIIRSHSIDGTITNNTVQTIWKK